MKKLIAILITTVITLNIWGAKAYPEPVTITQKDGKMLTVRQHGDEHFNYVATTDGVLLYQQGMDFYIALIDENGNMSSSGVLAHNAGQRTTEEITLIGKQDKDKFFAAANASIAKSRSMKRTAMPPGSTTLFPHTGTPKALVILADFIDQPFKHDDQTTIAIFKQYLNAKGRPSHSSDATLQKNMGSVAKYFQEVSNGAFVPQFEVSTVIAHLPDSMKAYGTDVNTNAGKYEIIDPFIRDVCNAVDNDIDFSQYDENNDGFVDLVYIIYAGYGQSFTGAPTETIWPKSGTVSITEPYEDEEGKTKYREILYDEKAICRYGVHSELNFHPGITHDNFNDVPQINGIGLFCHEFSHCMGLPDVYPTTKIAQDALNPAMEYWDIMDNGEYSYNGYMPTAYTAWEREFLGWMEMDVLKNDNSGQKIELISIDTNGGNAYKIFPDDNDQGNEYVYIQNIQPYGWNLWLANNLGHGMLVTYINYDEDAFKLGGGLNNTIGMSRMTFIPADEEYISSYDKINSDKYRPSHGGDPFPGTKNVHNLYSIPLISELSMDKSLLNIQEENHVVSFYYMFEPAEKNEDISEVNVHELSMITESDENQIINEHEWKDAEDNTIVTGYQVKNFQEVALGIESAMVNASDCNILSLCVKPSQAITLNVTLTSGTPETNNSNSKVVLGMNSRTTDNGVSTFTKSYELEAGEWRTLAIQLSSFAAQGVDLSEINSVRLSLGSEPDNKKDNILFLEDVYFSQSTQRAIATFINQSETTAKDKKVYTLDGRYVGKSTRGLAKGVYIINGKKTVIR